MCMGARERDTLIRAWRGDCCLVILCRVLLLFVDSLQVLLSPAQDVYYRFMHMRPFVSIADYPYCIIISGSKDTKIPLDDSIRLVETAEVGRCRLEVVDDDHSFNSLRVEDFRYLSPSTRRHPPCLIS